MRFRTMQGVQVLRRVRDFLAARDIPVAIGTVAKHVEALTAIVDRLTSHAVEQESRDRAARSATVKKGRLARELRFEYLRPIARAAKSLFPNDLEMRRALQMPPFRDHERLLATAYAVADRVQQHTQKFVDRGFAPDFVERLRKAGDAFKAAIDTRSVDVGRRAASTAGQLEELRRGREVVRLLEAMITPRLADSPDQLAEWQSLTRFSRVPESVPAVLVEVPKADEEAATLKAA